ncbi:MAG: cytochrome c oxidase assembly protein [Gammaproteobacteria bacterium]|nr:MAG: cytochrome c oxidase assembly protein [Gammaproteobacteria bacterium]
MERRNRRTSLVLGALVAGMFAFGFALVPLYRLVCQVTGSNVIGQARRADAGALAGRVDEQRTVRIYFDATVNTGLPWEVTPLTRSMEVHPGKVYEVRYRATNNEGQTVTAQAVPGVTPWQATGHLHKIECFCFSRQTLGPRESREMPLRFVIDPELPQEYKVVTLSYMLMTAPEQTAARGGESRADSG